MYEAGYHVSEGSGFFSCYDELCCFEACVRCMSFFFVKRTPMQPNYTNIIEKCIMVGNQ